MATATLQNVFDAARGELRDTIVPGGAVWTNSQLQTHFNQAWRRLYRWISNAGSHRVERTIYINLPAATTVLIPVTYGVTDFSEPEFIEERLAPSSKSITSTNTATPIQAIIASHGFGPVASQGYCVISGVNGTSDPWGYWGFTVIDSNTISLNGSRGSVAGTGGTASLWSTVPWAEVLPMIESAEAIDGQPSQYLGQYLWEDEQLKFRGAVTDRQLRIHYWASGSPPQIANQVLGIDDCIDLVACVTAANAANANGWFVMSDRLLAKAFGTSQNVEEEPGGLLAEFLNNQVRSQQRGPSVRRAPFRQIRGRFGTSLISS